MADCRDCKKSDKKIIKLFAIIDDLKAQIKELELENEELQYVPECPSCMQGMMIDPSSYKMREGMYWAETQEVFVCVPCRGLTAAGIKLDNHQ